MEKKENKKVGSEGIEDKKIFGPRIPDILDLEDLADLLRVSKQTARRLVADGDIPAYRFAKGKYLITKHNLIKTIDAKSNKSRMSQT